MTLYDTLVENQSIENAFVKWEEYRKTLTRYLIEQIPVGKKVAILGVGMCNDIDLDLLIEHVEKLYLVDKMKLDQRNIWKQYPNAKKNKDKVECMELDFVGITEDEYRLFSERLIRLVQIEKERTDVEELANLVILQIKEIYEKALKRTLFTKIFEVDYTIAIGLYSQLNNMFAWMWEMVLNTLKQKETKVFQFIASYNELFIKKFHQNLFEHVTEGMIIGCEIQRVGQNDTIQGSMQALFDIKKKVKEKQLICKDQAYVYWPFDTDQEIVFDVELLHLKLISQK